MWMEDEDSGRKIHTMSAENLPKASTSLMLKTEVSERAPLPPLALVSWSSMEPSSCSL